MRLICVLAFTILDVVLAKNVLRNTNEGEVEDKSSRWPLGIVSYYFDKSSYDDLVEKRVRLAMNTIEETSCVRFKALSEPWSGNYWIHITNRERERDCTHETAAIGTGFEIVMMIGIDCLQRRDILHVLMHALGFKDEVTHPKRDQYVRVLWENINPAYHPLFRIRYEDFPSKSTEYDPMSIMHFHDRAFTKNGQATIASLVPGLVINPSRELSPLDKMKLRLMFGHECNRREVGDLLDSCKNAMHTEGQAHQPDEGDRHSAKLTGNENKEAASEVEHMSNHINEENNSADDENENEIENVGDENEYDNNENAHDGDEYDDNVNKSGINSNSEDDHDNNEYKKL